MSINLAFTFDGCGINDATHPYAPRILTGSRAHWDDVKFKAACRLMEQSPALLAALRDSESLILRLERPDGMPANVPLETIDRIRALLAPFEGVQT